MFDWGIAGLGHEFFELLENVVGNVVVRVGPVFKIVRVELFGLAVIIPDDVQVNLRLVVP